ncbi:hypothetical protein CYMTET_43223 [Cymbomonas tetramitiformis]|uniref:Uncharacterized protein n=1 Tax=Cymbomonas tetramitiformis TaxID=36881 RepID=A0AAE0C3P5_9CHLO|nr:hypothetical protein CYMTET_43223 [Cymbomonas tetramitiformis]
MLCDECLKAIAPSGPPDERQAKRQLLSSLDFDFYKDVRAPLRLNTELDKVDIFALVLEVYHSANLDPDAHRLNPS